ncbi:uncharacterized protein LOC113335200 [Papaver somniferum]|uniref:uncharacterized protein LOC113335200 n=1 Tax=Papaver somniferum TaxID=3469 RepID=UPI000E6FFC40|nr:uncharacterized protein LOC113335200 [Papaver somniferum]
MEIIMQLFVIVEESLFENTSCSNPLERISKGRARPVGLFCFCTDWLVSNSPISNRVVPTLSMLSRRGMIVVNLCGFCDNNEESVEHLFLHCPFIWKIWEHFLQQLGFAWMHPTTIIDFLWKWKLKISTKPLVFLRYCLPFALWWVVWLERNDIQIAKKQGRKTLNSLIIDIKLLLLSWSVNVDSFKNMKLDDFVFDWKILFRE